MKPLSRCVVLLVIAGLVVLAGPAPFCPPAQARMMPCCDISGSHCATGLRAVSCCRVEPGTTTPVAPGARLVPQTSPLTLDLFTAAVAQLASASVAASTLEAGLHSLRDPVPLFLLNTSLLR